MKIRAEIELPIPVEQAYDAFITNLKSGRQFPGIKGGIENEIGNLGPGTTFSIEMEKPAKLKYKAVITEHIPSSKFTMETDVGYSKSTSEISFQKVDSGCLVLLRDTYDVRFNWQGFVVSLFPQATIKLRRKTWDHLWQPLKPDGKLFRKFSARHWGLPSNLIGIVVWFILVIVFTFLFQVLEHRK